MNTIEDIPDNICEDGTTFKLSGLSWKDLPITYHIDSSIKAYRDEIIASIAVWNDVLDDNLFVYSSTTNADLLIKMGTPIYEGALGVTSIKTYEQTDVIAESIIVINEKYVFESIEFSCKLLPENFKGPFDFQSVTIHELGHVLGLTHTNDAFTTMHEYYIGSFMQTLSEGDINGVLSLYG